MLHLNLYQFTHARACSRQISHHKVPFPIPVAFQAILQKFIVCVADDILQKVFLLNLYWCESQFLFLDKIKILIDRLYAQIYGFGLLGFNQIALERQ